MICALVLLAKDGSLKKVFKEWTLVGSLTASGLPAAIYALQNSLLQISYKNLDSLTFSMLNQTKLFFTALFTFIILRYFPIWISCISERSQFSNFCCIIYHIILEVTDSVYFHIFSSYNKCNPFTSKILFSPLHCGVIYLYFKF